MRFTMLAGIVAAAAAQATLIWQQSETAAVYTSASISRKASTTPTMATATWLNQPIYVEVFNVSDSGENIWSFASSNLQSTFMVDQARHAESFGSGAVDTVAAESNFVTPSNCNVFAFQSLGAGIPAWNWSLPNCVSSLLYDDDLYIDMSDDGSIVAFSAYLTSGGGAAPALFVFDGQTGKQLYTKTLANKAPGGPVQTSSKGAWVAWTNGDSVSILDGTTGALRDTIPMGWNTMASISDSGDYVAFSGESTGSVYLWDAPSSQYKLAYTLTPPSSETWFSQTCAISSDGTGSAGGELVSFGFTDEPALQLRVVIYSMSTGTLLTDYMSPKNAQLQTVPTIVMDGNYAGVCAWGDQGDVPTAIILSAGSNTPVFNYTTPGSMFGVSLVVDSTSAASDSLYFVVAGKHTPANVMGNGGDAYAWSVVVPK